MRPHDAHQPHNLLVVQWSPFQQLPFQQLLTRDHMPHDMLLSPVPRGEGIPQEGHRSRDVVPARPAEGVHDRLQLAR